MKKTIIILAFCLLAMAGAQTAHAQTEEETLVWLKGYGKNLSYSTVYGLFDDRNTRINRYLSIDKEKNVLYNQFWDYYNRELEPTHPYSELDGYEVGYADLKHLYIKPVESSTFYRADKSHTYFKYDYSLDGNKVFTGEKVAYYFYILEFSKPVVRYYVSKNGEHNYHQGSGDASLTLYFTNLEDAQSVVKAIYHLAKLQGAKPKPQVKKSMF